MKLLWNLQLSSVDATTGKIAITSDSNWHFTKNCIKALSDMEHTVLIPQHESVLDLKEFIEQASTLKVNWKYKRTSSPYGVFSSRQDWNSDEMKEILSEGHYLVWENNPSLVMNWYTAAKELGRNIKVITYNHWIDNSKYQKVDPSITYQFRQHEAYYAAKKVGFNSEFGRQIALEGYNDDKIWSPKAKSILEYKSFVLPPIVNQQEIDSYKT